MLEKLIAVPVFFYVLLGITLAYADNGKAPKSYPGHRGYGSSRPCPWNCEMAGIPKNKCREWRTGNTCYIEDFTRAPRQGNEQAQNSAAAGAIPPAQPDARVSQNLNPSQQGDAASASAMQQCRSVSAEGIGRPTVEISDVSRSRGGGFFRERVSIEGTIEGTCLIEAGVFEDGRKIKDIPVQTAREFRRFDFEVSADPSRYPEIRAYNVNGQRDIFQLSPDRE